MVEEGPSQYFGTPFTELGYYHGVTFAKPYDETVGGQGVGWQGEGGDGREGGREGGRGRR